MRTRLAHFIYRCSWLALLLSGLSVAATPSLERLQGKPFAITLDCALPHGPHDQVVRVDAPEGGWPAWSQSVLVLDAPPGLVTIRRGKQARCGMTHDARSTDSRFRSGVGAVLAPARGSLEPIFVSAPPESRMGWNLTIRYGDPAAVQREDTMRFALRIGGLSVLLAMLLSSLLVFANARDRIAGLFALATAAFALWIALRSGLAAWPRPWLPSGWVMGAALVWLPPFVVGVHWYISLAYARCDRVFPRVYRTRHWVLLAAAVLALASTFSGELVDLFAVWRLIAFAVVLGSVALMVALWREGQQGAKAVLIAVLPPLLVLGPLYGEVLRAWRSEALLVAAAWYAVTMTIAMSLRMGALRRQRDRLKALAERDPLTGLPNRRAMAATLPRRVHEAKAQQRPLSLVFVDIDHFKAINDTHGHGVGDQVLVEAALRLASQLRGGEMAARHGGEEFLIMLPGASAEQAKGLAERLRRALAEPAMITSVGPLSVTASFGVASLEDLDQARGSAADALVAKADAAMYRAKQAGRNRVEG